MKNRISKWIQACFATSLSVTVVFIFLKEFFFIGGNNPSADLNFNFELPNLFTITPALFLPGFIFSYFFQWVIDPNEENVKFKNIPVLLKMGTFSFIAGLFIVFYEQRYHSLEHSFFESFCLTLYFVLPFNFILNKFFSLKLNYVDHVFLFLIGWVSITLGKTEILEAQYFSFAFFNCFYFLYFTFRGVNKRKNAVLFFLLFALLMFPVLKYRYQHSKIYLKTQPVPRMLRSLDNHDTETFYSVFNQLEDKSELMQEHLSEFLEIAVKKNLPHVLMDLLPFYTQDQIVAENPISFANDYRIMQILVGNGFSRNSKFTFTIHDPNCIYRDLKMMEILFNNGFNPYTSFCEDNKSRRGSTLMSVYVSEENKEGITLLLHAGYDINRETFGGRTILDDCTSETMKKFLLSKGAKNGRRAVGGMYGNGDASCIPLNYTLY
jgi:hypothetical protein